jgi:tetratricopeptide (TPR) repeat protein
LILVAQGRVGDGMAAYRKAIELAPRDPAAYNNLGAVLSDYLGRYDKAIESYLKAIEVDPKYVDAHHNLGLALERRQKFAEAGAAYERAIAIAPRFAPAHGSLARLLADCAEEKLRDPRRAVATAEKALELDPTNAAYHRTAGWACYRAGDWKRAAAALEKSNGLSQGGDSFAWFFLAMAQWQLGNKVAAREWYGKAVQWMERNAADSEELIRCRAEADELLGVKIPPATRPPATTRSSPP